jgi:phage-related protein
MILSASLKSRFLHVSEQIIKFGSANVGMPHVKHLENKLWEIRLKSKDGIARSIYAVDKRKKNYNSSYFYKKNTENTTKGS